MASEYTAVSLTKLHIENFRSIAKNYQRGMVVGVGSWILEVHNHATVLVTRYKIKNANGEWSDTQTHGMLL